VPAGQSSHDPHPGSWDLEVFRQELNDRPVGQSFVGRGRHGDAKPVVRTAVDARVARPRCHVHRYPHPWLWEAGKVEAATWDPC